MEIKKETTFLVLLLNEWNSPTCHLSGRKKDTT
ncbi:hypothetical protein J2T20_001143 [Paenibacillus wynnii]|nr:hypothetical protein [Paenibacillus wynnii]